MLGCSHNSFQARNKFTIDWLKEGGGVGGRENKRYDSSSDEDGGGSDDDFCRTSDDSDLNRDDFLSETQKSFLSSARAMLSLRQRKLVKPAARIEELGLD